MFLLLEVNTFWVCVKTLVYVECSVKSSYSEQSSLFIIANKKTLGARESAEARRALDPLELELQEAVCYHVGPRN